MSNRNLGYIPRALPLLVVFVLFAAGCRARNPAQVSRERQGHYYPDSRESVPAPEGGPLKDPQSRAPEPVGRSVGVDLRSGAQAVAPGTTPLAGLEPVDLRAALASEVLSIGTNDPELANHLDQVLDRDITTLARSASVSPLALALAFTEPIRLHTVRVYLSYSTYDWRVRTAADGVWLLIAEASEEAWSQIDLEEPIETSEVVIEIRRLQRDDFVHLNELELYATTDAIE